MRTEGESDRVLERISEQSLLGREESSGGTVEKEIGIRKTDMCLQRKSLREK